MAWSDDQIRKLARLWGDGYSAGEIVAHFQGKFTRSAIIGKIHRLGISGRSKQQRRKGAPPGAFGLDLKKSKKPKPAPRQDGYPKMPRLKSEPVPEPRADDIATKTLVELEPDDCRWRVDRPFRNQPYGFCAKEALPGLTFCETHARRAYANWPEVKHKYVKPVEAREKEAV